MDSDQVGLFAGLIVLGVILLVFIIAGSLAIYLIFRKLKLRQHEGDIQIRLSRDEEQTEENYVEIDRHSVGLNDYLNKTTLYIGSRRDRYRTDSAIDVNEVSSSSHKGSNSHNGSTSRNGSNSPDGQFRPWSQASDISNPRAIQPNMSLIIKSEECRVYGGRPPVGQILLTAQNYYKATTNTDTVVPTEEVQLVDTAINIRASVCKVFTKDPRDGAPTSILYNNAATSFEDTMSFNKGVFVHKSIGAIGGILEVSGVVLSIPQGALEKETLISLGILWDEKYVPHLTKKKALLSPIILCQPSGLQFKVPVTLTFPHAAAKITEDWLPTILKREGALSEQSEWEPVTLADYEERDFKESRISLKLHHFTLYTLVGESKPGKNAAKLVHIVAYTAKLQRDAFFKPRLFCLNKYKDELEEVEYLNKKMDPTSKMAETTDLFIYDNENDITVEVSKLSDDWTIASDSVEVLSFEQVWHACHPHCTFVMKQKKTTVHEIVCEFHAYQTGNENNIAKLKIAEAIEKCSSPLSSPLDDDPVECLIRQLVIMLDPVNTVGTDAGDWKDLASKMGCEIAKIQWLGTQSSPTRVLLDKWIEDKGRNFEGLVTVLNEIHRPDAAEEVQNVLDNICTESDN